MGAAPVHAAAPSGGIGLPPAAGRATVAADKSAALAKTPKGAPGRGAATRLATTCGSTCYVYASSGPGFFTDWASGLAADVSVSNPFLASSTNNTMEQRDNHTLVEVAAISSGSAGNNGVEVGWIKSQAVCNQVSSPCLFVYNRVGGTGLGYNMAAAAGFVRTTGTGYSTVDPGDSLSGDVGTSKNFAIRYFTNAQSSNREGWWVAYAGLYVGYYPIAKWTSASETFVDTEQPQIYGEIAGTSAVGSKVENCTDMGSGAMAGTSPSTVLTNFTYWDTTDSPINPASYTNTTQSTKWGLTTVGSPATTIRIGGPGYDSDGDQTGVQSSCAPTSAGTPPASTMQVWEQICPDNGSTGCDAGASWTAGTTVLNQCYTVPAGFEAQVLRNNSGVSGRNYQFYRDAGAACTGSTVGATNGSTVVLGDTWDFNVITSVKRTG